MKVNHLFLLPISKPLKVSEGDKLEVHIGAGQMWGLGFVWNWNLKLSRSRGGEIRFAQYQEGPKQSYWDFERKSKHYREVERIWCNVGEVKVSCIFRL